MIARERVRWHAHGNRHVDAGSRRHGDVRLRKRHPRTDITGRLAARQKIEGARRVVERVRRVDGECQLHVAVVEQGHGVGHRRPRSQLVGKVGPGTGVVGLSRGRATWRQCPAVDRGYVGTRRGLGVTSGRLGREHGRGPGAGKTCQHQGANERDFQLDQLWCQTAVIVRVPVYDPALAETGIHRSRAASSRARPSPEPATAWANS